MATATHHLFDSLTERAFSLMTGMEAGRNNTLQCSTCRSSLSDPTNRLDLIEHLLVKVLTISSSILDQMRNSRDVACHDDPVLATIPEQNEEIPIDTCMDHNVGLSHQRDWLAKLRRSSTATASKYDGHVRRFEWWLNGRPINQEILEQYIEIVNAEGKSTGQLAAALKYRYVKIEKLSLDFTGLAEKSKKPHPHRYLEPVERDHVDRKLVTNPKMRLACKLLYDLAARS